MVQPPEHLDRFESLLQIVEALRGPGGCPWDKEQTHRSLTPYAIEEAHELAEAIETGQEDEMISELGDLLLQVVLHAEIGRQKGRFNISDVIRAISEKMVRRHPHVFSNAYVADSKEVLENWSKLKAQEKKSKQAPTDRFDVALSLPALARSQKIGEKTKKFRFDWESAEGVLKKVEEELNELKSAMAKADQAELEHEIGDLLFSVVQLARHLNLEAEQCLRTANTRFEKRFFHMKNRLEAEGKELQAFSPEELEAAWQEAKKATN
mgnify:FL=1